MLEILQDKNAGYLMAAYAVFIGGLSLYLISLVIRKRNLERDEALVEQITQTEVIEAIEAIEVNKVSKVIKAEEETKP